VAKDDKAGQVSKNVNGLVSNLMQVGRNTNFSTYKVGRDLYDTERILDKMKDIQSKNQDSVKQTVNGTNLAQSRLNTFGLTGNAQQIRGKDGKVARQSDDVFDVIKNNSSIFTELKQLLLADNKLYETIADYEILRRAIPEISRVINLLINSVIIPEVITSDTFTLSSTLDSASKKESSKKLKGKYELDKKIRTIVENYFLIGTEYITVVPYKAVVEAIKENKIGKALILKESALLLPNPTVLKESTLLTESTFLDTLTEGFKTKFKPNDDAAIRNSFNADNIQFTQNINGFLSQIKIFKSNKRLVYDAALVESVREDKTSFMFESSFEEFFSDQVKMKTAKDILSGRSDASEGLMAAQADASKAYDKISINGCKIERLDPARVYPIRIKDTVIAYVYIEERRDDALRFNMKNQMQNTFSFYRMHTQSYNEYSVKMMEDRMLREIGNRVIENLSPKFLEANFDNMDIFYEFLRENSIHRERRDIILLHPDDVIEFKRADGSIMKNAVFFAKLYLLMVINNILTKVRRGSDRTLYYVNNGLSNDIEGSVMEAIEAIQQSEIRFSDIGSIAGIIGSVGSVVDLFIPQSEDGSKPVNPEVISGQEVDMDEPFLKYLIKSIILSFNMPSVVVDFTDEVEFAKTLSMANLDVATSSALSQAELNIPLTKLLQKVMAYDLDLTPEEIESVSATLIPSRSMLMQITGDLIETTKSLAQSMADLNFAGNEDAKKQLFMKEFVREYFNYDWTEVDKIIKKVNEESIDKELEADVVTAAGTQNSDTQTATPDGGGTTSDEDLSGGI
jgi:hypothetical protein